MTRKNPDARKMLVFAGAAVALYFLHKRIKGGKKPCVNCTRFSHMTPSQADQLARHRISSIQNAPRIADISPATQRRA